MEQKTAWARKWSSFRTQALKENVWPLKVRTGSTTGLHRCSSPQQREHMWAQNSCTVPSGQCWEGQQKGLFETSQQVNSKRRIRENTGLLRMGTSHKGRQTKHSHFIPAFILIFNTDGRSWESWNLVLEYWIAGMINFQPSLRLAAPSLCTQVYEAPGIQPRILKKQANVIVGLLSRAVFTVPCLSELEEHLDDALRNRV